MGNQLVVVLDFGGQYKELIARRVRECNVCSVFKPGGMALNEIKAMNPIGIILTGGPDSVYCEGAPKCDPGLFELGVPILGICYGLQLMAYSTGGEVKPCAKSEYGRTKMTVDTSSPLFKGLDKNQIGLMSHTDQVHALPEGFITIAATSTCPNAAVADPGRRLYGTQFHPEVENTPNGTQIIRNFLYEICSAKGDYDIHDYETRMIGEIREQVGSEHVILGLSGGVDSSVCAALLAKAIPGQLHCIFVDHGLMRKNEGDEVEAAFSKRDLHFIRVNAEERFLSLLKGISDPEEKRKIIGAEFVRVFEDEAKKLGTVRFLAQGTIYPDVIESGVNSAVIKSHHNVGGLPADMGFKELVEPLRGLFKDEVRALGRRLGLPEALVERQPFPGPGLAVRVIGEITKEKLDMLREADAIFRQEMRRSRQKADQYFAVLTDTRTVGVMGDFRTHGWTVALRAVKTTDFMTCQVVPVSHSLLARTAARIVNEVKGVGRVVYDITGKPPATIEWE
ncbi:MAG: glutamine-hydrolyzing GMP synthase [Clostridiales bacterium]|jgi:GMP synthase (glutamine-hydrolysing)|nr:glutamine-hydrolyzing GMP synthase [Clostridiales bacterium]